MFNKVLIVDNHDAVSNSVRDVLKRFNVPNITQVKHCDAGFLEVKQAASLNSEFNLIITELSFKNSHYSPNLTTGEDLISALHQYFPKLLIIVYTAKQHLQNVRLLVNQYGVNGYVCKDQKGALELLEAMTKVAENKRYLSPQVSMALKPKTDFEIYDFDIELLGFLAKGLSQANISVLFKTKGISPNSLSAIEKRLNKLRVQFKAKNNIHLVATSKDLGLI